MKKILFLAIALTTAVAVGAQDLTTRGTHSRDYLRGHGHSGALADIVETNQLQANGDFKEQKVKWYLTPAKLFKGVHAYLDPAMDQGKFMRHDIEITPQFDDL